MHTLDMQWTAPEMWLTLLHKKRNKECLGWLAPPHTYTFGQINCNRNDFQKHLTGRWNSLDSCFPHFCYHSVVKCVLCEWRVLYIIYYVLLFNEARLKSIMHFTKKNYEFCDCFQPFRNSTGDISQCSFGPCTNYFFLTENGSIVPKH